MKTITGFFSSKEQAERAISELRRIGYDKDISLVAKGEEKRQDGSMTSNFTGGDGVGDGAASGATIGGLAGLALGAGALAIPGFGPLVAAGPIAAMLSGAATGGIAGGLADYGIPAEKGREFEQRIREGKMLVTVKADDGTAEKAAQALRTAGGDNVEIH
ncbi:membrane protein [Desulfotomaculum defluvii]